MKKAERAEMQARTVELERIAAVDNENVALRLKVAEQAAEIAKWRREAECERRERMAREERLKWIGQLAGSGLHPRDL